MIPESAIKCFSVGELSVIYRPSFDTDRQRITCSRDAYNVFNAEWSDAVAWREEFYIMLLNRANEVLALYRVSEGGVSGTVADPRVIFQVALGTNASGVILSHNHPSGNLTPSEADKDLTRKLKEAGRFLDIPVLDHLIVTPRTYLSFADEGIL